MLWSCSYPLAPPTATEQAYNINPDPRHVPTENTVLIGCSCEVLVSICIVCSVWIRQSHNWALPPFLVLTFAYLYSPSRLSI
ncbi:hypothetical protein AX14_006026 [Amanita brunnescens Koide BX004]|nr:hypothetical protein AX14_006026 [Amanita brunnescens Koide BX004]